MKQITSSVLQKIAFDCSVHSARRNAAWTTCKPTGFRHTHTQCRHQDCVTKLMFYAFQPFTQKAKKDDRCLSPFYIGLFFWYDNFGAWFSVFTFAGLRLIVIDETRFIAKTDDFFARWSTNDVRVWAAQCCIAKLVCKEIEHKILNRRILKESK